jgi:hypothetical protein
MKTELRFVYDENMRPISATCTGCAEQMPKPDPVLENAADIILFFSKEYIEHRKRKHAQDDRRRIPGDC